MVTDDFYCDQAISGQTEIDVVVETEEVLAFHHTRPFWPVHIVVVPKRHVPSLTNLGNASEDILATVLAVVRQVAANVEAEHGACRVLTNLGRYQDSKQLMSAIESFSATGDVLELACGSGLWTTHLLRSATSVTAVDGAPEMLSLARARVDNDDSVASHDIGTASDFGSSSPGVLGRLDPIENVRITSVVISTSG